MKVIHTAEIPVLWSHLDANGHVNNGVYQSYFDEARMQALESIGFSIREMRENLVGPVVLKAELTYHKPLGHPDVVRIETGFRDMTAVRGTVVQTMFRSSDGVLVCEANFSAIFFDFAKKRPWKIPKQYFDNLAVV
ncbi:MAG: acyl-CoA thioesterase [Leptospira bouyouniensis]|uniref:Acyl-CoA thioesterase n=1 Tax=Leptospira bouyouniensis TaxID=2484911 RepID=A0A7I0HWY1_9LEPT|nr:acyl-CoA thioesterase [Leptospira bouyouniensis]TGK49858.1 acyl-CoA thioesterase [Leptospira bouyouniensis]TGL09391.1 acyl-CoA thioesterase [Leptospira bouyouniensis]TGM78046.1 acyl-CoA thioesterase [Leptospira bouyouniensis]